MMTIIEGVGDEVVYFVGVALLVLVLAIAWSSTSVSDHTFIRTAVLVIERRRRSNNNTTTTTTTTPLAVTTNPENGNRWVRELATWLESRNHQNSGTAVRPATGTDVEEVTPSSGRTTVEQEDQQGGPETVDSTVRDDRRSGSSSSDCRQEDSLPSVDVCHSTESEPQLRRRKTSQGNDDEDKKTETVAASAAGMQTSNDERPIHEQTVDGAEEGRLEDSGASSSEGHIRVRLKFLNETQKLVEARLADQLGHFKQQHFGEELENNKIVRLIFNGQLLQRDSETLQFHGLFDNCVVHCHISSNATVPPLAPPMVPPNVEFDLGRIMLPLFGLILGLIWCCRIQYRQYFNTISTFALLCITGLFIVSVVAICLPSARGRTREAQRGH